MKDQKIEYEEIGLDAFFDENELKRNDEWSTAIVTLTDKESILRNIFFDKLKGEDPSLVEQISDRIADLEIKSINNTICFTNSLKL